MQAFGQECRQISVAGSVNGCHRPGIKSKVGQRQVASIARHSPALFAPEAAEYKIAPPAKLPTIKRMLVALVVAAVLPLLAFATFMAVQYARDQRVQYE